MQDDSKAPADPVKRALTVLLDELLKAGSEVPVAVSLAAGMARDELQKGDLRP